MSLPYRKILFTLLLLPLLGGSISALTKLSPSSKNPSTPALTKSAVSRTGLQLLKHEDGELILEWKCPDIQLEYDPETHRISSIGMAGAQSCTQMGVPRLPQLAQLLDCLPGKVTAEIVDMDADTRPLGSMAAMPEDVQIDLPVDSGYVGGGGGTLDGAVPPSWSERSARTPLLSGMWPPQTVKVQDAGVFRGHRLMSLNVFPVQVDAQRGIAHILKRIKVRVTMPRNESASASRIPDQTHETDLLRSMLGDLAPTALPTRMSEALEGRGSERSGRLDDFDPLHPRWKIIVKFRGIVRLTAADLQFAGCPVEQITAHDTHIKNRGHEIPIYFSGEGDNRFDEGDYIEFYGEPNQQTYQSFSPSYYQDPWTSENVYWLSWGDNQPGLRLADEDATYHPDWSPQQVHIVTSVRTSLHFEHDDKFERLPNSTTQFSQQLSLNGPLSVNEDHWFWGIAIDGLTSRNFTVYIPYPAKSGPEALHNITVRAAMQGYTFGAGNYGQHRAIVYLNGQTAPGLQGGKVVANDNHPEWRDQTPIILQTRPTDSAGVGIVSGDLINGYNGIAVSLPGDGLAGANDKVLANWFEIEYDRSLHASFDGSMAFPFDTTRGDTFSFEARGFSTRNISVWKLNHSRLTNLSTRRVTLADEGTSWAARFQLIADGAYQMLLFDDRYIQHPDAIVPETSNRDLRTLNGARYLIIYHDSFGNDLIAKPWLDRLDSLRRVTFDGSVDTIRVSQIYEQFNDGITNPEAIRNFIKYAYEHWSVRPTHVCLVGDGVMENKYSGARAGDLISSLYPLTLDYGAAASDMLFGCVAGPPWDITPDIAVGRISCRSATELETYVRKLVAYDDPAQTAYNSLYHCTMLAVTDRSDNQFQFPGLISEPVLRLLPDEINVARVYLDSLPVGQGPNVLRDYFRNGAVLVNYNGHGGGGVWSGTNLMDVSGVRQLNNHRAYPFITNFTCYVGAFDAMNQADVLGEAFEFAQNNRLDPVGGIGVYATTGPGWIYAGLGMQFYLFDFCARPPGMTLGEIVQVNKARFWGSQSYNWGQGGGYINFTNYYSMMMMMTLLGDPGVRLALPNQVWNDVHENTSLIHSGDTLRLSGSLPWDPAGNPSDVYLLPYNGDGYTYYRLGPYWDPVRQESTYVISANVTTSHVPAFSTDLIFPLPVTTRTFTDLPVTITPLFHTLQGHVVIYAVDPGSASTPPHDAISSLPLFLADSLTGLRVFDITLLPLRNVHDRLGIISGHIPHDSVFHVQVNLMNEGGIGRVKARGIFSPAQGPVALDTVEMTQVVPGTWRTPDLGPYDVYGGAYRIRFLVQPPSGGDFVSSDDYDLPLEDRNDYLVNSTGGIAPKPWAGKQPMFYVPIGSAHGFSARDVLDLPIRLTAIHDSTFIIHRLPQPDTTVHRTLDSISTTIHVTNLDSLPALFETWIPTYFWPQSYRVTIKVDPDNVIEETNENNNTYNTTLTMPNLFPATNELGTYMPRTTSGNTFHRFWKPGIPDTLLLKLLPGSLPMDSATLIYSGPDSMSESDLARLSLIGLVHTDFLTPARSWKVTLGDSSDRLAPGGTARIQMLLPNLSGVGLATVSDMVSKVAIFRQQSASTNWDRLTNIARDYLPAQLVRVDIIHIPDFPDSIRFDTTYLVTGRTIAGDALGLGRFCVFLASDVSGPTIQITVDGMHFTPHSILPRHPQIFANLSDLSGINRRAGSFSFVLDHDTIPDGQIAWTDSLQSGGSMSALTRPNLEPGPHYIWVKATDNVGNISIFTADFEVSGAFGIEWAINYPNPFQKATTIAYLLTDVADDFVECKIFTVSGRYIRTVREVERAVANYREIPWDGTDDQGREVANGVYFARLKAKQGKQTVEKMIKLAKVR